MMPSFSNDNSESLSRWSWTDQESLEFQFLNKLEVQRERRLEEHYAHVVIPYSCDYKDVYKCIVTSMRWIRSVVSFERLTLKRCPTFANAVVASSDVKRDVDAALQIIEQLVNFRVKNEDRTELQNLGDACSYVRTIAVDEGRYKGQDFVGVGVGKRNFVYSFGESLNCRVLVTKTSTETTAFKIVILGAPKKIAYGAKRIEEFLSKMEHDDADERQLQAEILETIHENDHDGDDSQENNGDVKVESIRAEAADDTNAAAAPSVGADRKAFTYPSFGYAPPPFSTPFYIYPTFAVGYFDAAVFSATFTQAFTVAWAQATSGAVTAPPWSNGQN